MNSNLITAEKYGKFLDAHDAARNNRGKYKGLVNVSEIHNEDATYEPLMHNGIWNKAAIARSLGIPYFTARRPEYDSAESPIIFAARIRTRNIKNGNGAFVITVDGVVASEPIKLKHFLIDRAGCPIEFLKPVNHNKMHKLSTRSKERLVGIKPILIQIIEEAISTSPHDFGIPQDGGLRTDARQAELYAIGRTVAGKIVTNADGKKKMSRHQFGTAFDIYAFVDGKASWNINHLTAIAKHLQKVAGLLGVDLEWGGDWVSFSDYPHFQIRR